MSKQRLHAFDFFRGLTAEFLAAARVGTRIRSGGSFGYGFMTAIHTGPLRVLHESNLIPQTIQLIQHLP
jgi:hypothetical protein